MRRIYALAIVLAGAGCRTATPERESPRSPTSGVAVSASPSVDTRSVPAPAARRFETWPPPDVHPHDPRQRAAGEKTIRLVPKEGGWRLDELFDWVTKTTGKSILFDSSNQSFKAAKIEFVGVHEIPESELFDWLQAVLSYRKLVLIPVGPKAMSGDSQWFVMDQADPNLKSRPVWVAENDLVDYADRDGLYIVTLLRVRDTVDTTRVRNALSPLSTQIAGIGRIQDVPSARTMIIGDFAPVVWAMKQLLDRMNALADTPGLVEVPAPPDAAPKR